MKIGSFCPIDLVDPCLGTAWNGRWMFHLPVVPTKAYQYGTSSFPYNIVFCCKFLRHDGTLLEVCKSSGCFLTKAIVLCPLSYYWSDPWLSFNYPRLLFHSPLWIGSDMICGSPSSTVNPRLLFHSPLWICSEANRGSPSSTLNPRLVFYCPLWICTEGNGTCRQIQVSVRISCRGQPFVHEEFTLE